MENAILMMNGKAVGGGSGGGGLTQEEHEWLEDIHDATSKEGVALRVNPNDTCYVYNLLTGALLDTFQYSAEKDTTYLNLMRVTVNLMPANNRYLMTVIKGANCEKLWVSDFEKNGQFIDEKYNGYYDSSDRWGVYVAM